VDCAIDPGRCKLGVAFGGQNLLFAAIVPKPHWEDLWAMLEGGESPGFLKWVTEGQVPRAFMFKGRVFLGDSTGSYEVAEELSSRGIGFLLVDEKGSTLEARRLYFKLHPPKGLLRLVPKGLLVPPRDVDDLAAWALLRRSYINAV
jgi:RNase H-fold protein (predicted Holliday junction resolvase)